MTENCGGCTLMRKGAIQPGTVGQPLAQVDIKIDQSNGEILMRAPWVMKGYYKNPEKTEDVLRDGYLHTGDQGQLTTGGYLKILGRVQDTFKTGKGKYITPATIEKHYTLDPLVDQVCVVGLGIPQPLALIVLSEKGRQLNQKDIFDYFTRLKDNINDYLADYEMIRNVVIIREPWTIENHLLTPTLKIKRNLIHRKYRDYLLQWHDRKDGVIWE